MLVSDWLLTTSWPILIQSDTRKRFEHWSVYVNWTNHIGNLLSKYFIWLQQWNTNKIAPCIFYLNTEVFVKIHGSLLGSLVNIADGTVYNINTM
jgi:hypothetical protein